MATENTAWQLEDFVDSLVLELDKTRETLAVKASNKPLTYTVKELALDLNIFPSYDGDQVRFVTAQPGEQGASKVTIQLGSITDQQVRATSKVPATKTDVEIADLPVDKTTRKKLRKLGVTSVDDLKAIEQRNVDIRKVSDNEIDYSKLANQIQKARRNDHPPLVSSVSLSRADDGGRLLVVEGERLAVDPKFQPVAVINQTLADVVASSDKQLKIRLTPAHELSGDNELILTFDPFAVAKVNLKAQRYTWVES
jgi:hypothetical protein